MNCAQCLEAGYVFCVRGDEGVRVAQGKNPVTTCCRNEYCEQVRHSDWNCTNPYSDRDYSYNLCPYKIENCGLQQNFTFEEQGQLYMVEPKFYRKGE